MKESTQQRNRRERPVCRSAPERTELFPIKPKTSPIMSFRPQRSGVEESITFGKEPTQDKTGYSGRFLDSLCSLGMTCWQVVLRILTGYICNAPGTAHRPFPTVSLAGRTVQPHGLFSPRCLAMNHRRYIAWFHSTKQVESATWRAANSRPYIL